jgi:acetyl esterase/lipase
MILSRKQIVIIALKALLIAFISICQLVKSIPVCAQEFVLEDDITFGKSDDIDLKLDLACPENGKGPFPVLVYLFGSGWGFWPGGRNRTACHLGIMQAAQRGYVAVSVDYRQTSVRDKGKVKYPFPAQLYDVKCAIRWLRANATKLHIDPNRIGVAGYDSGGHLALMLGLTVPSDGLEGNCGDTSYSSSVQAVVSSGGPTDLARLYRESPDARGALIDLLGGNPQEHTDQYAKASPVTYVRHNAPPILTIRGAIDRYVPPEQADLLDVKMKDMGASHTLIIKENCSHDNFTIDPEVLDFFDRYLKELD